MDQSMTSLRTIVIVLVCLAAISGAAIFWRVYQQNATERHFVDAVRELRPRAERGDAQAQSDLAFLYHRGQGVRANDAEAVLWWRKAASQGYAKAQSNLGVSYERGLGVLQDYAEAVRWYRLAADQGYGQAQFDLASMYHQGQGVARNYAEACNWVQKAAAQGLAKAEYALGICYAEGQGVPQDYTEAVRWYRRGADHGDAMAQYSLCFMYEKGKGVGQDYDEAVRWCRKAAAQGDSNAEHALYVMKAGSNTMRRVQYLCYTLVFFGGLWLFVDFLLPGRNLRDWRQKARTLAGLLAMARAGFSLYGIDHVSVQYSACANAFASAKGILGGMFIATIIVLCLAGWRQGPKTTAML
jgi:TPR repeat protein